MKFIRFLYGRIQSDSFLGKLRKEIRTSFKRKNSTAFTRRYVHYFTMGKEATALLRKYGVGKGRIHQVHPEPVERIGTGGCNSWNKLRLLEAAIDKFGEVIYTDFDAKIPRPFDLNMVWKVVRSHSGLGRVFQMPLIGYHRKKFPWRGSENPTVKPESPWDRITPRKGLNGSFIYLASRRLIQCFMDDFEEVFQQYKVGDEQAITYSIEKRFGEMTLRELYEEFEPEVIEIKRSPLRRLGVKKQHVVFRHR